MTEPASVWTSTLAAPTVMPQRVAAGDRAQRLAHRRVEVDVRGPRIAGAHIEPVLVQVEACVHTAAAENDSKRSRSGSAVTTGSAARMIAAIIAAEV